MNIQQFIDIEKFVSLPENTLTLTFDQNVAYTILVMWYSIAVINRMIEVNSEIKASKTKYSIATKFVLYFIILFSPVLDILWFVYSKFKR